jgi:hypothetical protein
LSDIIEINNVSIPFTIKEIDKRFFNFSITLETIKKGANKNNNSFTLLSFYDIFTEYLKRSDYEGERAFADVFNPKNLHELVYIILVNILKNLKTGLNVEKCKLCGKYFINYGKSDYIYCNRLHDDSDKTCRQIGSSIIFKQIRRSDPIGREYDKVYRKYYSRKTRGKMSADDFYKWSREAGSKFAAYKLNECSGEDFLKWLKEHE